MKINMKSVLVDPAHIVFDATRSSVRILKDCWHVLGCHICP